MTDLDAMWFCPECRTWVGRKLDQCVTEGHPRPRIPVTTDDVDVDHAFDVTRRMRLRVKARKFLGGRSA